MSWRCELLGSKDKIYWREIQNNGTSFFHRYPKLWNCRRNQSEGTIGNNINKENTKKFHQTEGSGPLIDDPRLYLDLGQYRHGPSVPKVLYGIYKCPNDTTTYVVTLLCHIQIPPLVSITTPSTLKSPLEFRNYWKMVKENTSFHGPHIGMYKDASEHPQLVWKFNLK